jgi:hypothetical protein
MKRALVIGLALMSPLAAGCTSKYLKGIATTTCAIWIHTMPEGALLYLNGNYVGRTPYKYTAFNTGDSSAHFIAPDLSEIMVRKRGYDDEVQAVTVANCYKLLNIENAGVSEQVKAYKGNITLYMDERESLVEKEYGNIVIAAVPEQPDAEIYLNDSLIGNGKTALLKLPAGSYVLKVKKPGYKVYARVISVLADNDLTITAGLEKASGPGTEVSSEMQAEKVQLSPPGAESELEEDSVPGTIGGKGDDSEEAPVPGADEGKP